ncbi:HlyD family efflux transporter periplasmic adaptor subunit [Clostridium butyricum]|uniref:HlyD family efflux transporter periplasmic adaptor subunit n=1 Tax=Clostridium butyricum TaxID=1492 RepID=UPI0018ABAFB6|nr:HlyD family efflux transporter periplasmic adaptor subunit [Clostridium butyricum]MDU0321877.1 HlyD family efflux transporter periplasmic adaptor subunit [Clostridium butyricum]
MRNIIQNLDDITDSKELIESKPHKFTSIFAYGLIGMLIIALIWSYFGEIDIVTKTNGVIKSINKTTSVLNEVEGKITSVNFKEGQEVKEGDVLYTLDCSDAVLNKENYEKQLDIVEKDSENINKLRNSILENTNYFDSQKADELEYYNKYQQYVSTNEKLQLTEKQTGLEIDSANDAKSISSESYTRQINENNDVMNNLNKLLDSINNSKNEFSEEDGIYAGEYKDYRLTIDGLKNTVEQKELELQSAKNKYTESMNDYESQMYNAKVSYDNSVLKFQQYKSNYVSDIEGNIISAKNSIKDIDDDNDTSDVKIDQKQDRISNIKRLIDSINSDKNLFDKSEDTYYKQYIDYVNELNKCSEEDKEAYKNSYLLKLNQKIDDENESLDQLQSSESNENKKKRLKKTISNLNTLRESVDDNENKFSEDDDEYYSKFNEYRSNINELQNNIEVQKKAVSDLSDKKSSIVDNYDNEVNIIKKAIESAYNDISKYGNKSALDIKTKLDETLKSINNFKSELAKCKLTPELDNINKELATNEITKYKIDTLVGLDSITKDNEIKIDELKTNIGTLQFTIDKSTVKAMIDGTVNVKADITEGELLQSGQEILAIIPKDDSQFKVKLYVSNKDISGINIGQKIKYHFDALPYKEYGELDGEITDIATDAIIDQKTGSSYYLVESEVKNEPLFSYKGEKGELKLGMTCEAQVVTKQKKILYYMLEKINLKN